MRLDYFYNTEGENFRFYQIPALLLEDMWKEENHLQML